MEVNDVFIVIVTYNRPSVLASCIEGVMRQEGVAIEELHVVVNSSDQPTVEVIKDLGRKANFPITYVQLANEGPAGGFHSGIKKFLESSLATHVWLMDDDIVALPGALHTLVAHTAQSEIIFPTVGTPGNTDVNAFGWWGVLLSRKLIMQIGLPMKELFYWAEDTEYLQYRIVFQLGIQPLRLKNAFVQHLHERNLHRPSWYYYYTIRNTLYYRLHRFGLTRYGLKVVLLILPKLLSMILFKEKDKMTKLGLLMRGMVHGVSGRIGKTVDPELNK